MTGSYNNAEEAIPHNEGRMLRHFTPRRHWCTIALCLLATCALAQFPDVGNPPPPAISAAKEGDGLQIMLGAERLKIVVCSDTILHVTTRLGEEPSHPQPWLLPAAQSCSGAPFTVSRDGTHSITLATSKIKATVFLTRGLIRFFDASGNTLLSEYSLEPRTYEKVILNGESTYHVVQRFTLNRTEAVYGLGQHENGMFNYRGGVVELGQNNNDIAIPFLVSTLGYGILWNSASLTYVDNRFPIELSFSALAGDGLDYFFVYGPSMDELVHAYRDLTGHVPMLPRWAYGFIQSRDRYTSMAEMLGIVKRYRDEHIPVDAIVQDWKWWKREGDPEFNANYSNVSEDLSALHHLHAHTMISMWPMLDPASETYKVMKADHLLIDDTHVYDATSAKAREIYWDHLGSKLFGQGWDSFWLDSAEPEEFFPHVGDAILRDQKLAIGNGAQYTNVFPLLHNGGIQQHWRATTDQKRVFLLTRSAFLGEQRVGQTVWSGDTFGSFWGLRRQVSEGLNYALSGMPYWTTDIGGYWLLDEKQPFPTPEYEELYMRWFEFGVFCPIFRAHGHRPANEMWTYPRIEKDLIAYDNLRYRLMPYLYSLAYQVHAQDSTIQRPLVMDFGDDPATWNIGDQFLFGPYILVSPVTEAGATERRLYLPKATWFNFWTGERLQGGRHITTAASLNRIPLFVRAGAILPLGPREDYADERPDGPIELRIYPGADGSFNFYQDAGDNYGYEKGQFATVLLTWSDKTRTLTLGPRVGTYPGMPGEVTFRVVLMRPGRDAGPAEIAAPDRTIRYTGREEVVPIGAHPFSAAAHRKEMQ
jgi:alpha-D-xyloside xylohydrolase